MVALELGEIEEAQEAAAGHEGGEDGSADANGDDDRDGSEEDSAGPDSE